MPKYIIEHFEEELFEWCLIEYSHISEIAGKENLIFTHVRNPKDRKILQKLGKVFSESSAELNFKGLCLLDSDAKQNLKAEDAEKFEHFLFGGILGDNPPRGRTKELIRKLKENSLKFELRNLGAKQMPTDTAVYAAKKILEGSELKKLKFIDGIEIEISENESVMLPYRYAAEGSRPVVSSRLVGYLKKKNSF